jgi:hypothetical protein
MQSKIHALIVWLFLSGLLLVWNRDFHLFMWWTWADYRWTHTDRLTFSLLAFGTVTYRAVESARGRLSEETDKISRYALLALSVVLLWRALEYP